MPCKHSSSSSSAGIIEMYVLCIPGSPMGAGPTPTMGAGSIMHSDGPCCPCRFPAPRKRLVLAPWSQGFSSRETGRRPASSGAPVILHRRRTFWPVFLRNEFATGVSRGPGEHSSWSLGSADVRVARTQPGLHLPVTLTHVHGSHVRAPALSLELCTPQSSETLSRNVLRSTAFSFHGGIQASLPEETNPRSLGHGCLTHWRPCGPGERGVRSRAPGFARRFPL